MKTDQAAKRSAKSNRKARMRPAAQRELDALLAAPDLMTPPPKPTVAIEQRDGTYLICEIEKDGTRRVIGRHIRERFAPKQQDD